MQSALEKSLLRPGHLIPSLLFPYSLTFDFSVHVVSSCQQIFNGFEKSKDVQSLPNFITQFHVANILSFQLIKVFFLHINFINFLYTVQYPSTDVIECEEKRKSLK